MRFLAAHIGLLGALSGCSLDSHIKKYVRKPTRVFIRHKGDKSLYIHRREDGDFDSIEGAKGAIQWTKEQAKEFIKSFEFMDQELEWVKVTAIPKIKR